MKRILIAIMVLAFSGLACQGDVGPIGPAGQDGAEGATGPPGQPGEDGAVIISIYGSISNSDYENNFIYIESSYISDDDVVQLWMSSDAETWAYQFIEETYLTNGRVAVYDPYEEYLGWDYIVKIIKNQG